MRGGRAARVCDSKKKNHKYTKENLKTYWTKKSQKIYKKIRKKIIKNYKKNKFLKQQKCETRSFKTYHGNTKSRTNTSNNKLA